MIPSYGDHAANERTFLAWVRTGLALMSFGIVIEKFDLFTQTLTASDAIEAMGPLQLGRLSSLVVRHDGVALIVGGLALVAVQTVRFVRNGRLLDDAESHAAAAGRTESIVSAVLVLLVAATIIYSVLK
jgi:putative membrane protein